MLGWIRPDRPVPAVAVAVRRVRFVRRTGGRRPDRSLRPTMLPGERLSEGVCVQLDLGVRLLGATVLRLDGDVVLTPARPDVVRALPARPLTPVLVAAAATADTGRLGSELDRAESLYGESVGVLRVAETRRLDDRDGSPTAKDH